MIKYQLRCEADHEFEGWFRGSDDFDAQASNGLLECPSCGSRAIGKAIMAPAISRRRESGRAGRLAEIRSAMQEAATRARDYVEKNFDYVGDRFPEEARKIHYGETAERRIYGEATGKEVKALAEEGVEIAPLPGAKPKTDVAGKPVTPVLDEKKTLN